MQYCSHPPHGGCGLKLQVAEIWTECIRSSPPRGMWIEMWEALSGALKMATSSPPRGMWIEMVDSASRRILIPVIPPTGDVD